MQCYVCGNTEIVQTYPVPLCLWHQTPPEDCTSEVLLPWDVELEEVYREDDNFHTYFGLDESDNCVYPI